MGRTRTAAVVVIKRDTDHDYVLPEIQLGGGPGIDGSQRQEIAEQSPGTPGLALDLNQPLA